MCCTLIIKGNLSFTISICAVYNLHAIAFCPYEDALFCVFVFIRLCFFLKSLWISFSFLWNSLCVLCFSKLASLFFIKNDFNLAVVSTECFHIVFQSKWQVDVFSYFAFFSPLLCLLFLLFCIFVVFVSNLKGKTT